VAGSLRLDMAQYRDLAAFAQFGSEQLDKVTQAQLARGQRLTEVLKQDQFAPLSVEKQVLIIFAGTSGAMDSIPAGECGRYERELFEFVETSHPSMLKNIAAKKALDDALRGEMKQALDAFKEKFTAAAAAR
jgi:F-type H+-transporting ATPase subunit alpha